MNIYLEKIASSLPWELAKSVGRTVKGLASSAGNQFHNALGGAYKDFAVKELKVTNPEDLTRIGWGFGVKGHQDRLKALQALAKAQAKAGKIPSSKVVNILAKTGVKKELRDKTFDGRINSALLLAGGGYGAYKAKQYLPGMGTSQNEELASQYYY